MKYDNYEIMKFQYYMKCQSCNIENKMEINNSEWKPPQKSCTFDSLRAATLNKRLNIQRRLAWSLCKDDTQNRREAKPF